MTDTPDTPVPTEAEAAAEAAETARREAIAVIEARIGAIDHEMNKLATDRELIVTEQRELAARRDDLYKQLASVTNPRPPAVRQPVRGNPDPRKAQNQKLTPDVGPPTAEPAPPTQVLEM